MATSPLVSIIIPCYNDGKHLEQAIQSVRDQSFTDYEVIIVDDGSTDAYTLQYLGQLSHWATVLHQPNAGPCVARHNGIQQARGKYLFFLDSDNRVLDTYISQGVAIMEADEKVGVVYADMQYCGTLSHIRSSQEFNIQRHVVINSIDICTVVRKSAYEDVGGFDMYLSKLGLEDWEIWFTFYEKGWKLHYIPQALFEYRVHDVSRTQMVANKNLDTIMPYVYRKHIALVTQCYSDLYYERNQLKTSINTRIGDVILTPYRLVKKLFKG